MVVYDFHTNGIEIVKPRIRSFHALGAVDGCLCVIRWSAVWMMEEYGVDESWTKYVVNQSGVIYFSRKFLFQEMVILG